MDYLRNLELIVGYIVNMTGIEDEEERRIMWEEIAKKFMSIAIDKMSGGLGNSDLEFINSVEDGKGGFAKIIQRLSTKISDDELAKLTVESAEDLASELAQLVSELENDKAKKKYNEFVQELFKEI